MVNLKMAVQNPSFLMHRENGRGFGYAFEFIKLFRPMIYLTSWSQIWNYTRALRNLGLNPLHYRFLLSQSSLNRHADILISFNGHMDQPGNCPIKGFHGLKIAHVGEFFRNPRIASQNLINSGVDYLLGFGDHPKHSELFRQHYSYYQEKLLPVPVGFSAPYIKRRAFDSRIPKCLLAVQTPGHVCDPADREGCKDYYEYYSYHDVSFPWLAHLREHHFELSNLLDMHVEEDLFHGMSSPITCSKLNEYMLFAAEGGLLGYPCARIFEGVAAGAILIAPEHDSLKSIGFEHGKNCLMHKPVDQKDFKSTLSEALKNIPELAKIADQATHWVHTCFSRDSIARWLHDCILELASDHMTHQVR